MNQPSLEVLLHPDYLRLEQELGNRIQAVQGEVEGFPSVLVVAPTRRLVDRVREALAERLTALAGVEVLHHQALVHRLVSGTPDAPGLAPDMLLQVLTERIMEKNRDLELADYALNRPGALSVLTRHLVELREAGIPAGELGPAAALKPMRELLERFQEAVGGGDLTDRPGLSRLAVDAARTLPARDAVFSYGAYDLVGSNLELLKALPAKRPTIFLIPADPVAPSWEFARAFVTRHLDATPEVLKDDGNPRTLIAVSRQIRNRAGGDSPVMDADTIDLAHTQGPDSELNLVARRALALIRDGVPPHQIGIVARSLEPFTSVAETIFERHGLPVDSSMSLPLSRFILPRTFRLLLEALGRDFERQPVIELARSSLLNRGGLETDVDRWWPGAWDQWSRVHGIIRGSESWLELPETIRKTSPPPWVGEEDTEGLERFRTQTEEQAESAELLAKLIASWHEAAEQWKECRTASEHAAFIRSLAERWIRDWDGTRDDEQARQARRVLDDLITGIHGLDWVSARTGNGASGPAELTIEDVLEFMIRSIETASVAWKDPSGVHFLDIMQARGLTFRHLFLIGFNEHVMPRHPRESPFLPDAVRRKLRETTGKPLAVQGEGRDEEWLLFAQTLASATGNLTITWQRADAKGKAISVSLYLRELARFLPGSPTLRDVLDHRSSLSPVRVPTHPGDAAAWLGKKLRLLTREEAALLTCESAGSGSVDALRGFVDRTEPKLTPHLDPGLELIRQTEQFDGNNLTYDGNVPEARGWRHAFSQSSLKALARCPQTFFFRYVLRVKPLDEAVKDFRLEARELGNHMHQVLEKVFQDLGEEGLFSGESGASELTAAALASLERNWNPVLEPVKKRIQQRFPLLYEHAESFWREEIEGFLARDLARLAEGGHRLQYLEEAWTTSIPFSEAALENLRAEYGIMVPAELKVLGIPDRVTRDREENWLISDYKTGGRLDKEVDPKEYLQGRRIQLPLYTLMARREGAPAGIQSELLGLGPVFSPVGGVEPEKMITLEDELFQGVREGFEETLAILATYSATGKFPFNEGRHCLYCDFTSACRRKHFPTRERVSEEDAFHSYFLTQKKTKTKHMLHLLEDD